MLEIWHGHLFLFVKLGQAAFRLVGTASHLVVIATDSSNVHSQPLNSYHCHPFKQCAHPATHSVGTAKPSNNVRIQRRTQLALPNTQTMWASSDALSWRCQTLNVHSQKFNRMALPSNPIAQPATQSFSIAIQSDHVQFDQQSFAKHSVGWH